MDEDRKTTVPDNPNWSESVEDLVTAGDSAAAISLLESVVDKLQTAAASPEHDRQLAVALDDLAGLYSADGFSLKADDLPSRASLIRHRHLHSPPPPRVVSGAPSESLKEEKLESSSNGNLGKTTELASQCSDDDWEAIADRLPDKLLSPQCLPGVSELSLEDAKPKVLKRRGRGTFSYGKQEPYSDHLSDNSISDNINDEDACQGSERNAEIGHHSTYGTLHVLVLADFVPSTKTIDLEKLFVDFKDSGVVIRWINDTTALAVFRTPSIALEAKNRVICPFTTYILSEDDDLLRSIPPKDLEPPRQRPKTSTRVAERMLAPYMGKKSPSTTSFGSKELRKQEAERRNRIVSRQKLKDDAWGSDD